MVLICCIRCWFCLLVLWLACNPVGVVIDSVVAVTGIVCWCSRCCHFADANGITSVFRCVSCAKVTVYLLPYVWSFETNKKSREVVKPIMTYQAGNATNRGNQAITQGSQPTRAFFFLNPPADG